MLWAIDYPHQRTEPSVRFMNTAPIPDSQKELVFHRNAERVFGIAPAPAMFTNPS